MSRLELAQVGLRDLFEIRMMIEPQAARLACIRGTDREIQEIARRAGAVAQAIQTGADFTDLEEAFHRAVAAAAHNQFMEQLMPIIHNALHEAWAASAVTGCLAQLTLQDNRQLMAFFRRRDGGRAQHAMAAHIRHTINVLDL